MLLAGVVMKLGAYGCLRVAMTLFPEGLDDWGFGVMGFHSWRDVIATLSVIGIVYGAMVALVQKDFKFVIGYSSVSHMGFVLLGLVIEHHRPERRVLQMFSHALSRGFVRRGRANGLYRPTRGSCPVEGMNLSGGDSVCRRDICHRGRCFDGCRLQRLRRGRAHRRVEAYPTLAVITGGILIGLHVASGTEGVGETLNEFHLSHRPKRSWGRGGRISIPERIARALNRRIAAHRLYPDCYWTMPSLTRRSLTA
jgi:hypothetical protein